MAIHWTKQNRIRVLKAVKGELSYKNLSTEELHQYVENYYYEDGITSLKWIIKQKHCDKGTILCLYWHLQHNFECYIRDKVIKEEYFKLLENIENLFLQDFYELENISFTPQGFQIANRGTTSIPKLMFESTKGNPFERLDLEYAFLRYPTEKEKRTIVRKTENAIRILKQTPLTFNKDNPESIVESIVKSISFWKDKDLSKLKISDLSYLWLDSVRKKYQWEWIIWDWETGKKAGVLTYLKI